MSNQANNKGGFLDQMAKKQVKPLVSKSLDESDKHRQFGMLKRRFETEFKDVVFKNFGLIPLASFKKYDVSVYEEGATLVESKTGYIHSIPYHKIKKFHKHRDHIYIVLADGKKFSFDESSVARIAEVGDVLEQAIYEYQKSR